MPDLLPEQMHAAVSLGILLLASLAAGIIADVIRVPKVTAYLLAGILVGPSVAHAISAEHMHKLEPLTKLAMALVLFELGCAFPMAHLRPILRRAMWLSSGELLATFGIVTLAVLIYDQDPSKAVLLGALALATAPATTVLVLKESNSEGPVTELSSVLVALNNIAAIIGFELLFVAAQFFSGESSGNLASTLGRLGMDLGGALLLGTVAGLIFSYGAGLLSRSRWLVMVLAVSILVLGLCESFKLPYMLAFLMTGVVLVNTSDSAKDLLTEKEKITGLLVVVFFAVHGAELELSAFAAAGILGIVYIVARSSGKILGIRWASRLRSEAATVRRYLGSCLLAEAGAAIALATLAAERWPEVGEQIQVIVLGSVVFFEIVGPICIRWATLNAGEVPLAHAISHRVETAGSQTGKMWAKAREAIGIESKTPPNVSQMQVSNLLRKNVSGLPQQAEFDEVINYIRRSHDNTFIVIDEDWQLAGIIRYKLLSDTFFDSSIDALVRAADLASPVEHWVYTNDSLSRAAELFRENLDDVLPVLSAEEPHRYVGIIRRGDLTELAIRSRN